MSIAAYIKAGSFTTIANNLPITKLFVTDSKTSRGQIVFKIFAGCKCVFQLPCGWMLKNKVNYFSFVFLSPCYNSRLGEIIYIYIWRVGIFHSRGHHYGGFYFTF